MSVSLKLSKPQQDLLNDFKDEGYFLHYMPYMGRFRENPYYFMSNTMKHYRSVTVEKLIKLGVLGRFNDDGFGNFKVRKLFSPQQERKIK